MGMDWSHAVRRRSYSDIQIIIHGVSFLFLRTAGKRLVVLFCFFFPLQQSVQNFLPEFSLSLSVQSITQRLFTISAALPMIFCLNAPGADADC